MIFGLFSWLDWSGQLSRKGFVLFALLYAALQIAALIGGVIENPVPWQSSMVICLTGVSFVILMGQSVRRLHDLGRNGAWSIGLAIPGIGLVIVLWLCFAGSRRQSYKFAPPALVILGKSLLLAALLLCVLRLFFVPFWVPSGSMKPTLLIGDYLIMKRMSDPPDYGDIIVFRHPVDESNFIKRVVGLPGDRVQMRDGVLFVNEVAWKQSDPVAFEEIFEQQGSSEILPRCANGPVALGSVCMKTQGKETRADGQSHLILDIRPDGYLDQTAEFTVPKEHVFVLGDNRDNSLDSRVALAAGGVGFVPLSAVQGRVRRVLFSSAGATLAAFWTWRMDRFWWRPV